MPPIWKYDRLSIVLRIPHCLLLITVTGDWCERPLHGIIRMYINRPIQTILNMTSLVRMIEIASIFGCFPFVGERRPRLDPSLWKAWNTIWPWGESLFNPYSNQLENNIGTRSNYEPYHGSEQWLSTAANSTQKPPHRLLGTIRAMVQGIGHLSKFPSSNVRPEIYPLLSRLCRIWQRAVAGTKQHGNNPRQPWPIADRSGWESTSVTQLRLPSSLQRKKIVNKGESSRLYTFVCRRNMKPILCIICFVNPLELPNLDSSSCYFRLKNFTDMIFTERSPYPVINLYQGTEWIRY